MTDSILPTKDDPYLTVAEVARVLRVSKMTAYRLIHMRELAATRVGRSFRVRKSAVEAYVVAQAVEVGAQDHQTGPARDSRQAQAG